MPPRSYNNSFCTGAGGVCECVCVVVLLGCTGRRRRRGGRRRRSMLLQAHNRKKEFIILRVLPINAHHPLLIKAATCALRFLAGYAVQSVCVCVLLSDDICMSASFANIDMNASVCVCVQECIC